jgi:uncharacterized protein (TIGR01777 family)
MRFAVTGSTGLIGSALVSELRSAGHSVSRLVRQGRYESPTERLISWNPERGVIDAAALESHDAVVHLAGEPIFGLWTQRRKARIRESRVRGTALLARTIAGLQKPPAALICASAMGYYGNRPANEALDESSAKGHGFLSDVVAAWEEAAQPAVAAGTRVVNTRFSLVLTPKGGSLMAMLPLFRAGLAGKLGSGEQVWSWITLTDVIGGIRHALATTELRGPVNFATPHPVTNAEFTRVLGRVLNRPTFMAAPAFALKLALGEMAEELLLSGSRVVPRKLVESAYPFRHPELEVALQHLLKRR